VDRGILDFALWAEVRERRIERVEGRVAGSRITLLAGESDESGEDPSPLPLVPQFIDGVSGDFAWQAGAGGWRLDIDRLVFSGDGLDSAPGRIGVEWRSDGGDVTAIAARAEAVPI